MIAKRSRAKPPTPWTWKDHTFCLALVVLTYVLVYSAHAGVGVSGSSGGGSAAAESDPIATPIANSKQPVSGVLSNLSLGNGVNLVSNVVATSGTATDATKQPVSGVLSNLALGNGVNLVSNVVATSGTATDATKQPVSGVLSNLALGNGVNLVSNVVATSGTATDATKQPVSGVLSNLALGNGVNISSNISLASFIATNAPCAGCSFVAVNGTTGGWQVVSGGAGTSYTFSNDFSMARGRLFTNGTVVVIGSGDKISNMVSVATITLDAKAADIFLTTLTNNVTLANPTNGYDGCTIRWRAKQDATGNRTVALGNKFRIPSSGTDPLAWSTNALRTDFFGATYNAADDKWDVTGLVPGY